MERTIELREVLIWQKIMYFFEVPRNIHIDSYYIDGKEVRRETTTSYRNVNMFE